MRPSEFLENFMETLEWLTCRNKSSPAPHPPPPPPSLPANVFPNKLATNVHSNIHRSWSSCFFASFLVVSLTHVISKPDSSKDLTVYMILAIFSSEIINTAMPDPKTFF